MLENLLHRAGQGGTRGAGSSVGSKLIPLSKYGPIAALVKAITRGILPAYLTMAGQTKILESLHVL